MPEVKKANEYDVSTAIGKGDVTVSDTTQMPESFSELKSYQHTVLDLSDLQTPEAMKHLQEHQNKSPKYFDAMKQSMAQKLMQQPLTQMSDPVVVKPTQAKLDNEQYKNNISPISNYSRRLEAKFSSSSNSSFEDIGKSKYTTLTTNGKRLAAKASSSSNSSIEKFNEPKSTLSSTNEKILEAKASSSSDSSLEKYIPERRSKRHRKAKKYGKVGESTGSTKWTDEEEDELRKIFAKYFRKRKTPGHDEREAGMKKSRKNRGLIHRKTTVQIRKKLSRMIAKLEETRPAYEGRSLRKVENSSSRL